MKTDIKFVHPSDSHAKFFPGIEENHEKFWRPPKMRLVPPKGGQKGLKTKIDVKFENPSDYYVNF